MNRIFLLVVTITLLTSACSTNGTLRAQESPAAMAVLVVDARDQIGPYMTTFAKIAEVMQDITPDAKIRLWLASWSGASSDTIYVTFEYPSHAALADAQQSYATSTELRRVTSELNQTDREVLSRAILTDITP